VHVVGLDHQPEEQPPFDEDGAGDDQVADVGVALVGVVGEEGVAVVDIGAEGVFDRVDDQLQRGDQRRDRVVDRELPALGVVDDAGEVVAEGDDRAPGGALQRLRHLQGDRLQAPQHHAEGDLIQGGGAGGAHATVGFSR